MSKKILLIPPTRDDWTKVKEIWEDPETMEAVGGGASLIQRTIRRVVYEAF
jgi:hypothetical protein